MKIPLLNQEIKYKKQALSNGEFLLKRVEDNEKKKQDVGKASDLTLQILH